MKNIDRLLMDKKEELNNLEIPEELEERLFKALDGRKFTTIKKRYSWGANIVAICLIALLLGYNFSTVAFYSKKLLGYDTIMNRTLQELNELGKGQVIGKTYTFNNGVTVTLDGVMIDKNQLLAFYTFKDPQGNIENLQIRPDNHILGFSGRHYMKHGAGELNEEKTEIKWISSYGAPMFLERTLSLKFILQQGDLIEVAEISFKIDREKAMKYTLKKNINQSFLKNETKVHLKSISASPTNTIVEGSLQNTFSLVKDYISGERKRPKQLDIRLLANGEEVQLIAGELSTDMKGITFKKEFDALPNKLNSLEIHIESVTMDHDVKEQVEIKKELENQNFEVLGQKIEINKVFKSDNSTHLTITTNEGTLLSRVFLLIDGTRVAIKNTTTEDVIKSPEGVLLHKRTLNFPDTGEEYELVIEAISFAEVFNKVIIIPIN